MQELPLGAVSMVMAWPQMSGSRGAMTSLPKSRRNLPRWRRNKIFCTLPRLQPAAEPEVGMQQPEPSSRSGTASTTGLVAGEIASTAIQKAVEMASPMAGDVAAAFCVDERAAHSNGDAEEDEEYDDDDFVE